MPGPPVIELLPDRDQVVAQVEDIYDTYRSEGVQADRRHPDPRNLTTERPTSPPRLRSSRSFDRRRRGAQPCRQAKAPSALLGELAGARFRGFVNNLTEATFPYAMIRLWRTASCKGHGYG